MRIPLEDLSRPDWTPMHVGDRARHATATSVRLLDPQTLVCCSLLGRRMYLIRFDLEREQHHVLDSVPTMFQGETTETDLCDVGPRGLVVTSNCKTSSVSFYRVEDDRIRHLPGADLPTGRPSYCHGVRFLDHDLSIVVAATLLNDPAGVYFYDVRTGRELRRIPTRQLPKDVCFLRQPRGLGRLAVIVTTSSQPRTRQDDPGGGARGDGEGEVLVYDLARQRLVGCRSYENGQFDSIAAHEDELYVADSGKDRILILDARTLEGIGEVGDLSFPHGVDVRHGMIAVACYGDNAVHVRRRLPPLSR